MSRADILKTRRAISKAIKLCTGVVPCGELHAVYNRLRIELDNNPRLKVRDERETLKSLMRKADDIFSKFIRLRDADTNGTVRCFTCGSYHKWQDITNGHFIKRQFTVLRFNEMNCQSQCVTCNAFLQGNDEAFYTHLVKKYGVDMVNWLRSQAKRRKWHRYELEALIKTYGEKVRRLLEEKGQSK